MTITLGEGTVLDGRYRLVRPLGEGGMGSVWVAQQLALQREVAVKMLLDARAPSERARLRTEALALAAVHHAAVVQVFDYGETAEGVPYVVMELMHGEPLSDRLARLGPYAAADAVALVLPLLDGLHVAHQAGVIHRDIKPANVVLANSSEGRVTLRLLDFGIARLEGGARMTAHGSIMGTPESMAPEQVSGLVVDARTDVWAAGLLLYQMVAGFNPFFHEDILATMRRVTDVPPAYPKTAVGLDGRLWGLLMGAMRKAPDDRPPSAAALRAQLSAWLEAKVGRPSHVSVATASPTLPAPRTPGAGSFAPEARPRPDESAPLSIDQLVRRKLGDS